MARPPRHPPSISPAAAGFGSARRSPNIPLFIAPDRPSKTATLSSNRHLPANARASTADKHPDGRQDRADFSRLLQFQKQKLPENSVMIAFFGEFFIFWYVDMFSSFYL
ncbi:hypothetical protein [Parageobacillus thermoglucosidasius]|uniref:hypothetical protein n=1 Tax=Parageobacillus thermoglucosidasius TaxID=1426 RepID=UPI00241CC1CC|nr:hypothetical protein [Parageobacillus thermoglucosidasius]